DIQVVTQAFPLKELPKASAEGHFAIAPRIPRDANARGDRVVVVLLQRPVRACYASEKSRSLTEVGSRNQPQPVTRIRAQCWIVDTGLKARNLVFGSKRRSQQ